MTDDVVPGGTRDGFAARVNAAWQMTFARANAEILRPGVTFEVYGTPAPQGSKRAFVIRGGPRKGQAAVIESSHDRVKSWRQAVIDQARQVMAGRQPLIGPLEVAMVFTMARPKSHRLPVNRRRTVPMLRLGAPARPASVPDLSKLARATEDALTDAGVWADDALVVEYVRLAKVWAGEDRDALDLPGALITVRQL